MLKKTNRFSGLITTNINVNMFAEINGEADMGKKKFEKLLLKNTLAIALPAVAVFLILIFMFMHYPLFEQIKCHDINDSKDKEVRINQLYEESTTNISVKAENLYYTGFDYYVDNQIKGAYYYSMDESKMMLYLVKTEKPEAFIEKLQLKGKIIKDTVSREHIIYQLATENNLDVDMVEKYFGTYIISQPDYPYSLIGLVYIFFATPIIICVLIIAYALLVWVNPVIHSQSKQLSAYGEPMAIIDELNIQLKSHLVYCKKNIYITADYMIVNYLTRTDVIKLDYIKYLSKNLIRKNTLLEKNKEIYRLTMSNPEKMFYEVDFVNEEFIDDVVNYIRGVNQKEKKA